MILRFVAFAFAIGLALSTPSLAADLAFDATLSGTAEPTATGSKAIGTVKIVVHPEAQTLDVSVDVTGITPTDFAQHLAHAPVGPMHLHVYEANGNVSLLLPFPMGPAYTAAPGGFSYKRAGYSYAEGAKILNSAVSFDGFIAALNAKTVLFNIHTNAFKDGEISGTVVPAK
jgi:hypothetical protein